MGFVLIDTSVWSLALRRKQHSDYDVRLIEYLAFLIRNKYAA